jgi:hypothetical protein
VTPNNARSRIGFATADKMTCEALGERNMFAQCDILFNDERLVDFSKAR